MFNSNILSISNNKTYDIQYTEIETRVLFTTGIIPMVKVYLENELILNSEKITNEEFYNCLKFLVPNDVFEYTKMILENGYDNNNEDDFDVDYDCNDLYGYDMFDNCID